MQMIFQNPYSSFNPRIPIGKGLRAIGRLYGMPRQECERRILSLMDDISLDVSLLERRPGELSGGQLQRLAIARALLLEPELILADEPTSALDVSVQAQILNLLIDLHEKHRLTLLFISHELVVVEHVCDRVVVLYLGAVMETAGTAALFDRQLHPYTRALISAIPREHPDSESKRTLLEGDLPDAVELPAGCRFHPRCPDCVRGLCDVREPALREVEPGRFAACHLCGETA